MERYVEIKTNGKRAVCNIDEMTIFIYRDTEQLPVIKVSVDEKWSITRYAQFMTDLLEKVAI